jgi:MFS family permease
MPDTAPPTYSPIQRERIYRRNFVFFVADNILFNLALGLMGGNTVVPDFVRHLTNSEVLIGLSGSIFMIGFTLPQLLMARLLVSRSNKKWWFVGPNIPVRFVMLLFSGLLVWLGRGQLGGVLVAFFICYSLAALGDGLVGVAWVDLSASSLDDRWRARMFGVSIASTGVTMLVIAPLIAYVLGPNGPAFPNNYAVMFAAAGATFVLSILPGLFFKELPGGRPTEKPPALREFLPQVGRLLRDDHPYRAFIILRILTSLFMMAAPFYVGYATVELGLASATAVPVLLAMQTAGTISGALLYTWLGARSNLGYIRLALAAVALLPVGALLAAWLGPWPLYAGFFVSGLAADNLLSAFMNWIVGYAGAEQRPVYTGLANTISALAALISPLIAGTLAQAFGYRPLFAVALVMTLAALCITWRYLRAKPHPPATPLAAAIATETNQAAGIQ